MRLSVISNLINATLIGNDKDCSSIASLNFPSKDAIVLLSSQKYLKDIDLNKYGAVLTTQEICELISSNVSLLITKDIQKSFILLASLFKHSSSYSSLDNNKDIVFLGKNINIGKNFRFGQNLVIEDNVTIGDNVTVGHNSTICHDVIIGNSVDISNCTTIGSEGFGNFRTKDKLWMHIPHLGKVVINDRVSIGSNCCIDRGTIDDTIIDSGVIIDNHVHIAHNVKIGCDSAIAANSAIAGSCSIGKRNLIGGMVGIIDHISTCDDVVISATSTIISNIIKPGTYTGIFPTTMHNSWKRIAFWVSKIDKMAKLLKIKRI